MTRTTKMGGAVELQRYEDGTRGTTIKVDMQSLAVVLLEIFLLREALADRLILASDDGNTASLQMHTQPATSTATYGTSSADLSLSLRDLEFIGAFLLRYYRDGVAEVTHVDINLYSPGSDIEVGTLIVQAADVKPSMSGEEARRILGIG